MTFRLSLFPDQIHFLEDELEKTNDDAEKALQEMQQKYEREIKALKENAQHTQGKG